MRPIMSKEVRARLRRSLVSPVQMIRATRLPMDSTRRQISPVSWANLPIAVSYSGRMRACAWCRPHDQERGSTRHQLLNEPRIPTIAPIRTSHRPIGAPRVPIGTVHMHACNHTKKFISYKSHCAVDAKYLIMANAVTAVGPWKCDGLHADFRSYFP